MVDYELIIVDGTEIVGFGSEFPIVGELFVSYSITHIGYNALNGLSLTDITLPSTITYIGANSFGNSGLSSIIYMGTISNWNAINKSNYWNLNDNIRKVYCLDGAIEL